MSILKYIAHNRRLSLADMYRYLTDPEKTDRNGLIGYGLNPLYAVDEMELVQRLYHFEGTSCHSKRYQHVIFAFDEYACSRMPIDYIRQIAYNIGLAILPDERQMFGAIHYKNTDNVHCHYMMNYVSMDGNLYRQQHPLHYYKNRVNAILQTYGLKKIVCYVSLVEGIEA